MTAPEPWPFEVKQHAMSRALDVGSAVASEETGVPESTIRMWHMRTLDLVRPYLPEELQSAKSWHALQGPLTEAMAVVVAKTAMRMDQCLDEDRPRDLKDYAVTLGITIEKSLLMAGHATSRTETLSSRRGPIDQEIRRLEAELGYRTDAQP